jgi:hypothetical protein
MGFKNMVARKPHDEVGKILYDMSFILQNVSPLKKN